jgi:ureidoglycolate lyase
VTESARVIEAQPLTRRAFAPFGDVIETEGAQHFPINRGAVERFHDLASVDPGEDGRVLISIVEALHACADPVPVALVERHPLGSQAFVPLGGATMCVVVARAGETVGPDDLHAFVSNGRQGVNYHPGTWHMPLVAFDPGQRFLVVDRGGPGDNCDERALQSPVEVHVEAALAAGT